MINSIPSLVFSISICFGFLQFNLYGQEYVPYPSNSVFNDVNQPKPSSLLYSSLNYDNIDLSKGRVAPSIPLDILECNGIKDQISLNYTGGSGIKVDEIASDVGLGWELQAGGYIKRNVRGFADDQFFNRATNRWMKPWEYGQLNGQKMINGWLDYADWGSVIKDNGDYDPDWRRPLSDRILANAVQEFASKLYKDKNRFTKGFRKMQMIKENPPYDRSPMGDLNTVSAWFHYETDKESDLYEFNCGGYSGKFIINGLGQCVLIPENPNIIGIYPPESFGGGSHYNKDHWLIIAADGRQFVFPDTSEYTESVRSVTNLYPLTDVARTHDADESIHWRWNRVKWNLKEVSIGTEHKNRKAIMKYYYEDLPIEQYLLYNHVGIVFHKPTESESHNRSMVPIPDGYFASGFSEDDYKNTIQRHTLFYNYKKRLTRISIEPCSYQMHFKYEDTERIDLKNPRKALSSIVLNDYNGKLISKYEFKHYFTGLNTGDYSAKRLMLSEFQKLGEEPYKFVYNSYEMPSLGSDYQDYWGYLKYYTGDNTMPQISTTDGYDRFLEGVNRSPSTGHAQASILKKITYPTKGAVKYFYEPNDYHNFTHNTYANTNQLTGGVRIQKIERTTPDGNIEYKTFSYKLPSNSQKSSGQIPPHLEKWNRYGAGRLYDKMEVKKTWDGLYYMYVARQKFPKYFQTNDLLRYSHVTINYPNNNGKKVIHMTAFDTHPDENKKRYAWRHNLRGNEDPYMPDPNELHAYQESIDESRMNSPTVNLGDRSYFRGLILSDKKIDKDGNVVSELINEYDFKPQDYTPEKVYGIGGADPSSFFVEYIHRPIVYTFYFDIYEESSDFFHIKKSTERTYNTLGSYVENITEYSYDPYDMLLQETKELKSKGNFYVTKYRYPEVSANDGEKKLIIDFRRNKPVQVTKSIMSPSGVSKIISDQYLKYRKWSENVTEIEQIVLAKGEKIDPRQDGTTPNNLQFTESIIIKRDLGNGNVLEYKEKDTDKKIVNIWGYKGQYLIAKLEGDISYNDIERYVSNLELLSNQDNDQCISDLCNEGRLRKSLNSLRDLPQIKNKVLVTTYTYNPLVGLTSVTDINGVTIYYHYDTNNRLKYIKDIAGNIVSKYNYNYAKQ